MVLKNPESQVMAQCGIPFLELSSPWLTRLNLLVTLKLQRRLNGVLLWLTKSML
ncbi:hypothetical protein RchiOBHm_Chr1g0379871 [Rosa chinensis]|uniref:Uncharacterized protein n=1 Tax=Rosa chinensis TaxID=74649 RepID=A0A2P6SNQ0_ROSCH|nr:hypothetical protein RchiOBHm_Chr1g0379871 [Rosa chinensis]